MAVDITGAATFPVQADSATLLYGGTGTRPTTEYSGVFIPAIWSGKLLEKFYASTVLGGISNTDYEGEIRNMGDKVIIRQKPTITINDYVADQNLVVERPSSPSTELQIDQGKYFNTVLDDVMEIQSDLNMMSIWADDAAEQMKIVIDTEVLQFLLGKAHASNRGVAAGALSANINLGATTTPVDIVARGAVAPQQEPLDLIIGMGQALDEQNIPENSRWIVVPAWFAALIKKSELRDASLTGDSISMARNGRLGMVDRFTIYVSNLLPAGVGGSLAAGETAVFAGTTHALSFAAQLSKMETLRSEQTFGTLMRGLQVYGREVLQPETLVEAIVAQP